MRSTRRHPSSAAPLAVIHELGSMEPSDGEAIEHDQPEYVFVVTRHPYPPMKQYTTEGVRVTAPFTQPGDGFAAVYGTNVTIPGVVEVVWMVMKEHAPSDSVDPDD